MTDEYKIIERRPTLDEFHEICASVGWESFMNFDVATAAINNSLYSVVVTCKNQTVGMGRIVGDGHIYFYIQDIAVMPDHQRNGLGKKIMDQLFVFLKNNAKEKAFIGLFAAEGTDSFYEKYGIKKHNGLTGIFRVMQKLYMSTNKIL
jgi:ribosomal protein S18 acetylase RimI-like enzyme